MRGRYHASGARDGAKGDEWPRKAERRGDTPRLAGGPYRAGLEMSRIRVVNVPRRSGESVGASSRIVRGV
jgi:hypothetical protein